MTDREWWQRGLIYQIYPRSFMDASGDGVGDLAGIESRLDYLVDLGIDAIWLSPIFPSPMADFGYDVSDYCEIDPLFGSLAQFDRLIAAVHARGLRLILDFVPNHTSDRHPWFLESRSSRDSAKRDWYHWRDPAPGGGPPNNWLSFFNGGSWEWDETTGQYYLHSFLKEQPDLNWRNPDVRRAMFDALRFWLDRGVDGFRVDVLWLLIKDDQYRDNPPNPLWIEGWSSRDRLLGFYDADRPEVQDVVAEMRGVLAAYGTDRVLIGEIYLPVERLVAYYGEDLRGAQLPFNFQLIFAKWDAPSLARMISRYAAAIPAGAWPNWVLGNHDRSRVATRIGSERARLATLLLLTLRGTPTLYYGDEIGMEDVAIPAGSVRDPAELREPGIGLGRDPERSPMPWTRSPLHGFTTGEPWLPFGDDASVNVEIQSADPASTLAFTKRLISLRREHPELHSGTLHDIVAGGDVLTYARSIDGTRLDVLLNFGHENRSVPIDSGTVLISTHGHDRAGERARDAIELNAGEGVVLRAGA